jgi:SNF2 family DNA or RNA helicase
MSHSQDIAKQRDAIEFLQARDMALLSLCPGYGKCRVSLLALPYDTGHLVIICPPVVLLHWPAEVQKWRRGLGIVQVIRSAKQKLDPAARVTVVSYGVLTNRMKKGGTGMPKPDAVIIDEFHMIKTPFSNFRGKMKGQRTRATLKLFKEARIGYMLSGTPILNRPSELGIALQALGRIKVLKNFQAVYCAGWQAPWGWVADGKKPDIDGIKELLEPVMFRRPASDLKLITAGRLEPRVLELDQPVHKQEKKFNKKDILKNPNPVAFEGLSELLRLSGVKKATLCASHVANVLEMETNVVVFVNHTEVALEMCQKLSRFGVTLITGETKDNAAAAAEYQSGGNRVCVINTQCGVGVNLFKASYVIFAEAPWNPSILDQCISRCDRVGQTEVVRTDILTVHKSIDAMILHHILTKDEIIESVITTTGVIEMSKEKFSGIDRSLLRVVEFRAQALGLSADDWLVGAFAMDEVEPPAEKPAKKKPAKKKVVKKIEVEIEEEEEVTIDEARTALKAYMTEHGGPAARKVLESCGAAKLTDVEDFGALVKLLK